MNPQLKRYWSSKGATVHEDGTKWWPCGCHTTPLGANVYCDRGAQLKRRGVFLSDAMLRYKRIGSDVSPRVQFKKEKTVKRARARLFRLTVAHLRNPA